MSELTIPRVQRMLEKGFSPGDRVVLGNESCDMDSAVSSIVTAAMLDPPGVPVLNVERDDLPLRGEIVWMLRRVGIDASRLAYAPELFLADAGELFLVDHNKLGPDQEALGGKVRDILDHHAESGLYKDTCPDGPRRVVQTVGSTCTLVALRALDAGVTISPEIAQLLLGTILVDTLNNDPAMKKSTPLDVQAAASLRQLAFPEAEEEGARQKLQDDLYDALSKARFDTAHLSIAMSLRKDFKVFKMGTADELSVGMSSVLESLPSMEAKGDLRGEVETYVDKKGLSFLIIMALVQVPAEGGGTRPVRSLLLHPPEPRLAAELTSGDIGKELKLEKTQDDPLSFDQGNVAISRKLLTPKLVDFFKRV